MQRWGCRGLNPTPQVLPVSTQVPACVWSESNVKTAGPHLGLKPKTATVRLKEEGGPTVCPGHSLLHQPRLPRKPAPPLQTPPALRPGSMGPQ